MKNSIYIFLLLWLGTSCLPEDLTIDNIPAPQEKLVVSSNLIPSDTLVFTLTRSVNALDPILKQGVDELINKVAVREGEVTISGAGKIFELQPFTPGLYILPNENLEEGALYTLKATDRETGIEITSQAYKPIEVFFDTVRAYPVLATNDSLARVEFLFQDVPDEQNFYMINVQMFNPSEFEQQDFIDNEPFTHLITDEGKDGMLISGEFTAFDFNNYNTGDTLLISMGNISKEYYDFLDARESDQTGVDLLYEPFNYPTNVDDGYGVFSLHTVDLRFVVLSE